MPADPRLERLTAGLLPEGQRRVRRAWELIEAAGDEQGAADTDLGDTDARVPVDSVEAALVLKSMQLDADSLSAALLGDAFARGRVDLERLRRELGNGVERLVEGAARMSRIGELRQGGGEAGDGARLEGLRKLLLAMAEDLRVVLITLAYRLAQMRGAKTLPPSTRVRVARETMDIYAPLANRLGVWQVKWELEDLAFRFLEPESYQSIARQLDERRADRERYIAALVARLSAALRAEGIPAEVSGRPKHIYSIWRKMRRKHLDFKDLFDVRAVRVLTDDVRHCYAALGVVHGLWTHVPKEFDDYIANPKGNDYRSLHTAVVGPEGRTVEVQIRTHEMHHHAELGVAAHWRYKEGGKGDRGLEGQIAWLRQLLDVQDEAGGEGDFLDRFKTEVFHDRVYALTPRGRVVDLPRGATPLDFAYAIHSEVGHRCRGAKVGGAIVPLTYELQNGDRVEILTARQGRPSRDWLNAGLGYLKTARARARVRQWFKQQEIDQCVAAGRNQLERELRRLGAGEVSLERLAHRLRFASGEALFAAVGRGEVGTGQIAGAVRDQVLPAESVVPARPRARRPGRGGGDVVIEGVGNLATNLARCCRPAPPEPIVGYITRGHGVTIHRRDCQNALRLQVREPARIIDVAWSSGPEDVYPVDLSLEAYDRKGLLRDITLLLAEAKVNLVGAHTYTDPSDLIAHMRLTVEVTDVQALSRVLHRLAQLPNVIDARRAR